MILLALAALFLSLPALAFLLVWNTNGLRAAAKTFCLVLLISIFVAVFGWGIAYTAKHVNMTQEWR